LRQCALGLRSHVQRDESGTAFLRSEFAVSAQGHTDKSDRDSTALRPNRIKGVEEVLVKRVLPHRYAAEHGRENYDAFFKKYHGRVM